MSDEVTDGRTRGERNNNPGNLEYVESIKWNGQTGSDGRYAVFDTAINGIRAMMIDIHTGFYRDNENTVRKVIREWAPFVDGNPEEAYTQFVAARMGVGPDTVLNWHTQIIPLTRAIVEFENGRDSYDLRTYEAAKVATGR